jgi:predicted deacylase
MIRSVSFHAETSGPKLLVLGAVHGDEVCGALAVPRVMRELETGALALRQGRVTFVPVCNPRAYAANKRYIERNLNRYLVPVEQPDCYEARLGNILCGLLADCDILLDLHSSPCGTAPHVFAGPPDERERAYAAALGPSILMTGWEDVYGTRPDPLEGIGTEEAARRLGALAALVECGRNGDPQAVEVAYRAVRNALAHFGMSDDAPPAHAATRLVKMERVYYREDEGTFAQPWEDFSPVAAGQLMAIRAHGERLCAPADGVIVIPQPDCALGQEWFYFGTESVF